MRLPPDPSGLPSGWTRDPSHRAPNGERYRDGRGNTLDFHRPGKNQKKRGDHWHYNEGKEHLRPGDEVPDPEDPEDPPGGPVLPPGYVPGPGPLLIVPLDILCALMPELPVCGRPGPFECNAGSNQFAAAE